MKHVGVWRMCGVRGTSHLTRPRTTSCELTRHSHFISQVNAEAVCPLKIQTMGKIWQKLWCLSRVRGDSQRERKSSFFQGLPQTTSRICHSSLSYWRSFLSLLKCPHDAPPHCLFSELYCSVGLLSPSLSLFTYSSWGTYKFLVLLASYSNICTGCPSLICSH